MSIDEGDLKTSQAVWHGIPCMPMELIIKTIKINSESHEKDHYDNRRSILFECFCS